ncbi:MAG: 16S rRNA (cytosine(1407)-C(5))-methyltransferase RsmF, partial [Vibrio sp.]
MHANIQLPTEFLDLIQETMPSHLSLDDFIAACQRPLRRSIRVNTLKISCDEFLQLVKPLGWQLEPIPWCDEGFWIARSDETTPLGNTAQHLAGLFYIQEASSMLPVTALTQDNSALTIVLDMASAPGSKTTQIAAKMQNQGALIANEYSASRVKVLSANVQRCGVMNTALTHFDANVFGTWLPESFDSILLDAPCSGEGTIRKDADAMQNWSLDSIDSIADKQKELIKSAFYALKPGGHLVYSTCTLNQSENQAVCLHLKQQFGDAVEFAPLGDLFEGAEKALTQDGFLHVYPQVFDSEGFFVAKIIKRDSVTPPSIKKRLGKFPFSPATRAQVKDIKTQLAADLGLQIASNQEIWLRDKEVWLFPSAMIPFIGEIRFSRIGLKLAETVRNAKKNQTQYRWQHQGVVALYQSTNDKVIELTTDEARQWYMGRDV